MTDDLCEKTFKTYMQQDTFQALAKRTCRNEYWISIEGRDRNERPNALFLTVIFSTIEDRDRFVIAVRFAEEERAAALADMKIAPRPAAKVAGKQFAAA
jgi:hypothetical protein